MSTRTSWASGRCSDAADDVPGGLRLGCEVMAIFVPTSALVSVDLPALGRPTKQANPARNARGPSDVSDHVDLSACRRRRRPGAASVDRRVGVRSRTAA